MNADGTNDASFEQRIDELIALAAVGELSDAEAEELDAALERVLPTQGATVGSELDTDLEVAAILQTIRPELPSASLKAQIMAAIDEPSATQAPRFEPVSSLDEHRRRRVRRWQPLAAAAAVALLFAGGIMVARGGSDRMPSTATIVDSQDAQQRTLEGELAGTLDVIYSADQDAIVVIGTDIPVLSSDETYQLWLVDADGAESVGLFRPDDGGFVEQRFTDIDPSEYVLGVTVEVAAGADVPTMPIIAQA